MLQKGDTVGVFQLESEGMRRTLSAVRPTNFGDIIALVSLYRPGPMDNIPSFGRRKQGTEPIVYPHDLLEPILSETYGIFVYQEQVMQAAQILAGFSLGGAQGKFALALHDGQWYEPSGRQPSTHIFKPGIQPLAGSDVTEHITLQIARSLGIEAAVSTIGEFAGEHVLIVERFDRFAVDGVVNRLHQEDFAQATGTSHVQKYESDGGPGYRDIFAVFDRHLSATDARSAKERFAKLLVFSWIVGHNDGHSKNYSLTHVPGRSVLAPFYDLNSALPFTPQEQVLAHDPAVFDQVELAFSIEGATTLGAFGARCVRRLEIDARMSEGHLREFALDSTATLQPVVASVIESLPSRLRELPAVALYPHATYTQTLRVNRALS